MKRDNSMFIGSLDIGGTKTIAAVTDTDGVIHKKKIFPTNIRDYTGHFSQCCVFLKDIINEMGFNIAVLGGIGINVPGMVDYNNGVLLNAPFAAWKNLPVRDIFQESLQNKNVFVDNDVKSCALAEKYFGYKNRYNDYIWVTLSTGIGAALVVDGGLYRGPDNLAGELGHIKVEYDHPAICSCGKAGCLEAHASGTGITNMVLRTIQEEPEFAARLKESEQSQDARGCAVLAKRGDKTAQRIYSAAADYLARGFSAAINLLNPQAVILGGGVANDLDLFVPEVYDGIKKYGADHAPGVDIVKTNLGYEAALIGTAALVLENR